MNGLKGLARPPAKVCPYHDRVQQKKYGPVSTVHKCIATKAGSNNVKNENGHAHVSRSVLKELAIIMFHSFCKVISIYT